MDEISFYPGKPVVPVNRCILGHFIEHLGRCIENGIWTYETPVSSEMVDIPKLERVRLDLFTAVRDLHVPVLRWPGGCFSDTYHWEDGIGPRETRPARKNAAWGGIKNLLGKIGPVDRNHFGTDEFLTLCDALGSMAYININYGSGTPAEAARWVEYARGGAESPMGGARTRNGKPAPCARAKIWGIGNELYGFWETGYERNPADYARKYVEFAKAMKAVDPTIKLVAVGKAFDQRWNRAVLEGSEGVVDYLSIHLYLQPKSIIKFVLGSSPMPETEASYYSKLNSAITFDRLLSVTEADILHVLGTGGLERCKISLDEWNVWTSFKQLYRADTPCYRLDDGLWTALILNTLIRHAKSVGMANFAQMVNTIGMILTYDDGLVLTPHYLAFKMYVDAFQPLALPLTNESETIVSRGISKTFPPETGQILDVAGSISLDRKQVSVFVVNKDYSSPKTIKICFTPEMLPVAGGDVIHTVLTHENPFAVNDNKHPRTITLERQALHANTASDVPGIVAELPPHSASAIQFTINEAYRD